MGWHMSSGTKRRWVATFSIMSKLITVSEFTRAVFQIKSVQSITRPSSE